MAILLEPPTRVLPELPLREFGGTLGPDRRYEPGFARHAYRCPSCGTLEYTDSVMAGACQLCPGLVGLVAI